MAGPCERCPPNAAARTRGSLVREGACPRHYVAQHGAPDVAAVRRRFNNFEARVFTDGRRARVRVAEVVGRHAVEREHERRVPEQVAAGLEDEVDLFPACDAASRGANASRRWRGGRRGALTASG